MTRTCPNCKAEDIEGENIRNTWFEFECGQCEHQWGEDGYEEWVAHADNLRKAEKEVHDG